MRKQKINYHRTCPVCSSNFSTTYSRRTYCSDGCYKKAANLRRRAKPKTTHKTCPVCGIDFITTDFRRIYCSYACYRKASTAKDKARHRAKHKKVELTPRPCIVCGKLFTPEKTNAKLICSVECERERDLRMQRQAEAKALGLTYGQYVALLGGE